MLVRIGAVMRRNQIVINVFKLPLPPLYKSGRPPRVLCVFLSPSSTPCCAPRSLPNEQILGIDVEDVQVSRSEAQYEELELCSVNESLYSE